MVDWVIALSKLEFSIKQSIATVFLSLFIGGGLAILEHQLRIKPSKIFFGIMSLPVFLPSIIVALGFIIIFGTDGWLNSLLMNLHLPPLKILYTPWAIIISHCYYNVPLAYLAIANRLGSASYDQDDVLKIQGANQWQILRYLTWPRIKQTIVGIGIIIFIYAFLSFNLPLILGGVRYQTLEVYIYSLITQQYNIHGALGLSIVQFLLMLLVVLFSQRWWTIFSERNIRLDSPIKAKNKINPLSILRFIIALFILLPLAGVLCRPPLSAYIKILSTSFPSSLSRSFLISIIVLLILLPLIILILNFKHKYTRYLILFLAISPVTLGVLMLWLLPKNYFNIIIAYIFLLLPVAFFIINTLWEARPNYYQFTLRIMGANPRQIFWQNYKYLKPALLLTCVLSIIYILGDAAISTLLAPYQKPMAMGLAYSLLGLYRFTQAGAMINIILMIIIFSIILIFYGQRYVLKGR